MNRKGGSALDGERKNEIWKDNDSNIYGFRSENYNRCKLSVFSSLRKPQSLASMFFVGNNINQVASYPYLHQNIPSQWLLGFKEVRTVVKDGHGRNVLMLLAAHSLTELNQEQSTWAQRLGPKHLYIKCVQTT